MNNFRAFRIHQDEAGHRAGIEHMIPDALSPGEVLIKVAYSAVNYKDALAGSGRGRILRSYPLNGGIDVAGRVVASTDPASGRPVADGATVTLDVSNGPARISVPDVTGMSQSAATDKLNALGFTVTVSDQTQSSNNPAGEVAAYSPTGTATQGSTITLVLSSGPGQAIVPDVTGMNIADATAKLQGLGFQVVTHHVSVWFKTVLHQSPDGGKSTNQGGTVTLYY